MREVLTFIALLVMTCLTALLTSVVLPAPDGLVFAALILLSAAILATLLGTHLSDGRINGVGDVMRIIDTRSSRLMALTAHMLGCSTVAALTVLLYQSLR